METALVRRALDESDAAAALALVDRSLSAHPAQPNAWHALRAEALLALGRRDEARAEIGLFAVADDDAGWLLQRSQSWSLIEDRAAARADADRAVAIKPNAATLAWRAHTRERSDVAGIKADAEAALAADPHDSEAIAMAAQARIYDEDFAGALALLDQLVALQPDDPDQYLTRARVRLKAGLPDGARDDLAAAHDQSAGQASMLNSICYVGASAQLDLADALAACEEAVRLKPDNAKYLDSHGLVLLRLGRTEEAIAAYDSALAHEPGLAIARFGRGVARARLGLADAAAADRAEALRQEPALRTRAGELFGSAAVPDPD